jgi:hypothetical protein
VLINLFEARLDELLDEMGRCDELEIEVARRGDRTDRSGTAAAGDAA